MHIEFSITTSTIHFITCGSKLNLQIFIHPYIQQCLRFFYVSGTGVTTPLSFRRAPRHGAMGEVFPWG